MMEKEIRFSVTCNNEVIDDVIFRWVCLYIVARKKNGNYNYDDKDKVIKDYIKRVYINYPDYIDNLKMSDNLDDKNELSAIENCEVVMPLTLWRFIKTSSL